jgi:hypothetical protein
VAEAVTVRPLVVAVAAALEREPAAAGPAAEAAVRMM